ncbi:hypothetical protein C8R47DRAFT_1065333 [Mycena vitilis]|nr:hypothetical protein C8R47DRAFT_1065333 [Mycena vitilis]
MTTETTSSSCACGAKFGTSRVLRHVPCHPASCILTTRTYSPLDANGFPNLPDCVEAHAQSHFFAFPNCFHHLSASLSVTKKDGGDDAIGLTCPLEGDGDKFNLSTIVTQSASVAPLPKIGSLHDGSVTTDSLVGAFNGLSLRDLFKRGGNGAKGNDAQDDAPPDPKLSALELQLRGLSSRCSPSVFTLDSPADHHAGGCLDVDTAEEPKTNDDAFGRSCTPDSVGSYDSMPDLVSVSDSSSFGNISPSSLSDCSQGIHPSVVAWGGLETGDGVVGRPCTPVDVKSFDSVPELVSISDTSASSELPDPLQVTVGAPLARDCAASMGRLATDVSDKLRHWVSAHPELAGEVGGIQKDIDDLAACGASCLRNALGNSSVGNGDCLPKIDGDAGDLCDPPCAICLCVRDDLAKKMSFCGDAEEDAEEDAPEHKRATVEERVDSAFAMTGQRMAVAESRNLVKAIRTVEANVRARSAYACSHCVYDGIGVTALSVCDEARPCSYEQSAIREPIRFVNAISSYLPKLAYLTVHKPDSLVIPKPRAGDKRHEHIPEAPTDELDDDCEWSNSVGGSEEDNEDTREVKSFYVSWGNRLEGITSCRGTAHQGTTNPPPPDATVSLYGSGSRLSGDNANGTSFETPNSAAAASTFSVVKPPKFALGLTHCSKSPWIFGIAAFDVFLRSWCAPQELAEDLGANPPVTATANVVLDAFYGDCGNGLTGLPPQPDVHETGSRSNFSDVGVHDALHKYYGDCVDGTTGFGPSADVHRTEPRTPISDVKGSQLASVHYDLLFDATCAVPRSQDTVRQAFTRAPTYRDQDVPSLGPVVESRSADWDLGELPAFTGHRERGTGTPFPAAFVDLCAPRPSHPLTPDVWSTFSLSSVLGRWVERSVNVEGEFALPPVVAPIFRPANPVVARRRELEPVRGIGNIVAEPRRLSTPFSRFRSGASVVAPRPRYAGATRVALGSRVRDIPRPSMRVRSVAGNLVLFAL